MKYRIVNRFRFITFVTLMMLLLSFGVLSLVNRTSVYAEKEPVYTEVTVQAGDTLWAIAKEYGSASKDIREVIHDICKCNHTDAASLRPGQVLLVPQN